MSGFDALLAEPVAPPNLTATRRAHFAQANASQALEGLQVSDEDLAVQERVISGELKPDEAIALYIQNAKRGI